MSAIVPHSIRNNEPPDPRVLEDLAEAGARTLRRSNACDEQAIARAVAWVLAVAQALRVGLATEGERA